MIVRTPYADGKHLLGILLSLSSHHTALLSLFDFITDRILQDEWNRNDRRKCNKEKHVILNEKSLWLDNRRVGRTTRTANG